MTLTGKKIQDNELNSVVPFIRNSASVFPWSFRWTHTVQSRFSGEHSSVLSAVFSWFKSGYHFGQQYHRTGVCSCSCPISESTRQHIIGDTQLPIPKKVVSPRFLHCFLCNVDFLIPSFLLHQLLVILLSKKTLPLPHLVILVWTRGFFIIIIYLTLQLSHIWPVGAPLSWLLHPVDTYPRSLSTSLLSATKMCHAHLALCKPLPRNQTFLQGDVVLFNEEWHPETEIWEIGCSLLLDVTASRPSQQTKLVNACVHAYTHTLHAFMDLLL